MSIEDLALASQEIDANLGEYIKAKSYYDGEDSSKFLNEVINNFFKDEEFTGTLNYASIPVNAVADRLQLLSIKGENEEITKMISDLWSANKMQLRFGQFVLDILTYGEYYVAVWPDEQDASELFDLDQPIEVNSLTPLNRKAKMMFCDAATTRAFYDDGGEHLFTARKWIQKDANNEDIYRANLYYDDVIEKYWWKAKDDISEAQEWMDEGQTEWPSENPYKKNPIFHFSTAFPHGLPEHRSLYGVQDALNKIFQTHIASIEYLGFPIIYTLMDETSAAGTSDFEADIDDDDVSDVNKLKNSPGEVWAIRAKSIGQLEPAGSTNFITSLSTYKEIAADISQLPEGLFMSTDGQHPGAAAQNAAGAALRSRVVDRAVLLSEPLKHMIAFSLHLAFGIEVEASSISIQWRPQKIEIDADVIQIFEFKLRLGIPEEQILTELGYTDAEIAIFKPSIDARRKANKEIVSSNTSSFQDSKSEANRNTADKP